jgi:flagellar export protein FliJ
MIGGSAASSGGAWRVLRDRAQRQVDLARLQAARARRQLDQLRDQGERLSTLMNDYSGRHEALGHAPQVVGDHVNRLRFLEQMRDLSLRLSAQVAQAEFEAESARRRLHQAELALAKYERLLERQALQTRLQQDRREARALDDWSVLTHARRSAGS